jgi:hypothetical protein
MILGNRDSNTINVTEDSRVVEKETHRIVDDSDI